MQANALGNDIIFGAVTHATFRGPPIIACSTNYNNTDAPWAKLLDLATLLNAPAIHTDYVHDGGAASVLTALGNLQSFYTPGFAPPWVHSSGTDLTSYPIAGPIFYFDTSSPNPSFDGPNTGGGIAVSLAQQSVNYRRNHLYGYASDAIWPVLGENLDRIQRPPIHRYNVAFYNASNYFINAILPQWRAPQLLAGQAFRDAQVAGLAVAAAHEAAYPGITRHVNPLYIRAATSDNLFAWPWLV